MAPPTPELGAALQASARLLNVDKFPAYDTQQPKHDTQAASARLSP